jgi:WbqC-like protein family
VTQTRQQRRQTEYTPHHVEQPAAADLAPRTSLTKRVAVMQPYFFPYAGYYRLFAAVDEFVIFDCVQFPRRGRVHRTEVTGPSGRREWLTLPLAHQPVDVLIKDLAFRLDTRELFDRRLVRFGCVGAVKSPAADRIRAFLAMPMTSVIDYLEASLRLVAELLGFNTVITRSSVLGLDPSLRGQPRVLAVAQASGATHYINAPGGRALYDAAAFDRAGIQLSFLSPYQGRFVQFLPALMTTDVAEIRGDIISDLLLHSPSPQSGTTLV